MPRGPREVAASRLTVLAVLLMLLGAALIGPGLRLGDRLGREGETADWLAGLATEAEWDAVAARPVFELKRRFREKTAQCTGVTAETWPLRLEARPGRLLLRHAQAREPVLEVDFLTLKREGLRGPFAESREVPGAPEGAARAVLAAGLLGVHAPGRPCPPRTRAARGAEGAGREAGRAGNGG